jgi:ADP-ribose pyrophosphatase
MRRFKKMHLNEETKNSTTVYDGKIFRINKDIVTLEDNSEAVREYVVHHGGVCVLPLTEKNEIIMVRQYRYPLGTATLEVPAGKLCKGEEHCEAGKRELLEETGAVAGEFEYLGEIYPIPAYTTEIIHMYLAKSLSYTNHLNDFWCKSCVFFHIMLMSNSPILLIYL